MEFRSDLRPSPIAGSWYPGVAAALKSQIQNYLKASKLSEDELSGEVIGLVAPHAGYIYSGRTAAYAYKAVQKTPHPLVVILSPFHPHTASLFLTTAHSAYQTPLGAVPVAVKELQVLDNLMGRESLPLIQIANDKEHSLEIQLPFLQTIWETDFSLIPVMVRTYAPEAIQKLAECLYQTIKEKDFLVIASTDLSHFYPLEAAEVLDAEMLRRISALDAVGVLSAESDGSASACGAGAVAAMLWIAEMAGADKAKILNYSTSADETGDIKSVVGYGAAAILVSC
jgi:AmmeMemoRadiSam system protein B